MHRLPAAFAHSRITIAAAITAAMASGCTQFGGRTGPSAGASPSLSLGLKGVEDRGDYVLAGVPQIDPAVRERMLQYFNVRSATVIDTNDDSRALQGILIQTRLGNAAQLHLLTQPGGARTQLTFYDEPVTSGRLIPGSNGERILLLRDVGGTEDYQVYYLDVAAGRTTRVTDGKGQHGSLIVARNGKRAAFYGTGRNGRDYDTYLIDLAGDMKPELIHEGTGAVSPIDFSPQADKILLMNYVSNKESHILLLDLATRQIRSVTPPDRKALHDSAEFSSDGAAIFYTADHEGEFQVLYKYDLATGNEQAITKDLPWDVESVAASPAGNAVVFTTNENGLSRLYRLDSPQSLSYSPVPVGMEGLISAMRFNHAGTHLCLTFSSATSPGDVFTLPVSKFGDSSAVQRWTWSEIGGLDPRRFIAPTRIAFETFDEVDGRRRTIPAYYYKPAGTGPFPVVISVHGGPEAQFRPSFSGLMQYFVTELGIAVIAPNVRGSTGYGRTFHTLDDGMKREDSVRDIGALLDWIAKQPELDAKRVGIFGGSYGGYMVLASMTNYPDRIKAGIDVVGIANFVTFLERTRDYRRDLRRREYGDEQDPAMRDFLVRISPLNNADKIRGALFVAHGQNDPRVPLYEAEQIVKKMQDAGRTVWFFMAKGEGHGFRKRSNSDVANVLFAMFLERHLKG
ncbi:MAG: alpha/beta fold hydrolase [Phycisphaerae bacterium]|nr:alpha/beta fold hydrolase [Phycisphaerae bacterium]